MACTEVQTCESSAADMDTHSVSSVKVVDDCKPTAVEVEVAYEGSIGDTGGPGDLLLHKSGKSLVRDQLCQVCVWFPTSTFHRVCLRGDQYLGLLVYQGKMLGCDLILLPLALQHSLPVPAW